MPNWRTCNKRRRRKRHYPSWWTPQASRAIQGFVAHGILIWELLDPESFEPNVRFIDPNDFYAQPCPQESQPLH